MLSIVIGILISAYMIYVIYGKVKDLKQGKSCCGTCDGCSRSCGIKEES